MTQRPVTEALILLAGLTVFGPAPRSWPLATPSSPWSPTASSRQTPDPVGTVTGVVYVRDALSDGAVVYVVLGDEPALPPAEPALMDQRRLLFAPSILPVLPGRAVIFRNSDPLLHNVFSPYPPEEAFNLGTYPEGESRTRLFRRPGPHVILCHIHPEMEGYVVVVPTLHYAVTDSAGRFRLEGVPAGTHPLRVWHRRAAPYERRVMIGPDNTVRLEIRLARGRLRDAGS